MKSLKFLTPITISLCLFLTSCGGGSSANTTQSFVAGNGAVTFVKPEGRKLAPIIQGLTLTGSTYKMEVGKVAVVNVWASWCSPCRAESPALSALSKSFPEVNFVGILTRDSASTARAFVKRFEVPYPTLVDDSILIGFHESLIANAIPTTVIIDKSGKVAARISGEITVASLTNLLNTVASE